METQSRFARKVTIAALLAAGFFLLVLLAPQWVLWTIVGLGGVLMLGELAYFGLFKPFLSARAQHYCNVMVMAVIFGLAGIALMIGFPNYQGMLLTTAVAVVMTDSAAQLIGMRYGKPGTFMPKVSPNKSLMGALGGVALGMFAVFVAILVWKLLGVPLNPVVGYTLMAVPLLAVAGDLLESATKRSLGIKDFGCVLGRDTGGVLDRLDSWLPSFFAVAMAQTVVFYTG